MAQPIDVPDAARRGTELSTYSDLHGVDITALDARDVAQPNDHLPPSPSNSASASVPAPRGHSPSLSHVDTATRSHSLSNYVYPHANAPGSSPSLSIRAKDSEEPSPAPVSLPVSVPVPVPDAQQPSTSTLSVANSAPDSSPNILSNSAPAAKTKPNKKRLPQVLGRSKSLRAEDQLQQDMKGAKPKAKPSTPKRSNHGLHSNSTSAADLMSARPAPSDKDRSFKDIVKSSLRDRSQDRAVAEAEAARAKPKKEKSKERDLHPLSSSHRNNNTSAFFTDFRHSSSRATDGITKAGKGFFNKFTRSGSTHDRPMAPASDEEHVPRVLTLPLIEQTRMTRIAKSYDNCKDKTEFWMPALPWRCIDYLNGKCEEEGLYRVSGGLTKVKEWRKRFDIELDVNLLDETELYDASIIASLFKEWIRELPQDIFPKESQARVVQKLPSEAGGKGSVPEILRHELQNLPPFNYYLLFAITCHLSLLLSYQNKNKMSLDNLYRCFNQSLRLDGRVFYTLVGEWRQCWAGCLTETEYLKTEYDYLQHPYPQFMQDGHTPRPVERATSSSESGAPPAARSLTPPVQRPATSHTLPVQSQSDGEEPWITPIKKNNRSSSDVTGLSPMRFNVSPLDQTT